MNPATILHEAETELLQAVAYYESKAPGLGLDFNDSIARALRMICESPDRFPLRVDGTRRYLIQRFPYIVVYAHENAHVWVLAFAHCKRRPGYWTHRSRPQPTP